MSLSPLYGFQEVSGIQEIDPDLVILDFMMGGEEQGWQSLQKIRMNRETQDLPIIVCTGPSGWPRSWKGT